MKHISYSGARNAEEAVRIARLARELGITRQTLLNKLSKYGLL